MSKMYKKIAVGCALLLCAAQPYAQEKLIVLNEGNWQSDNGKVTYFEDGRIVSNQWFRDVNGYKIGDTPNDIIQIRPNLIAISVNWSNIIQFIDATGKAVGATEDIPNNRCLATDGKYLYVSTFGHECGTVNGIVTFEKGFVAKIDATTLKVISATEVGWEPQGIAYYDGKLFVANTGGYSFDEPHDYEQTISVLDAATMNVERTIDTQLINLCGDLSLNGQYICVSSPGDYYDVPGGTIILDCRAVIDGKPDDECFVRLDRQATINCKSMDDTFYAIGTGFSYITGSAETSIWTIDPRKVMESNGEDGVYETLPGSIAEDVRNMQMPYGLYVNPYTGYIYGTDAAGYVESGTLYQWSPEGKQLGKFDVYINPGSMLALNPKGESGVADITVENVTDIDAPIFNLQGIEISNPMPGNIYIKNGKKFIQK